MAGRYANNNAVYLRNKMAEYYVPCWHPKQLKYIIKREDALSSEVKSNNMEQNLPFSVMYNIAS